MCDENSGQSLQVVDVVRPERHGFAREQQAFTLLAQGGEYVGQPTHRRRMVGNRSQNAFEGRPRLLWATVVQGCRPLLELVDQLLINPLQGRVVRGFLPWISINRSRPRHPRQTQHDRHHAHASHHHGAMIR